MKENRRTFLKQSAAASASATLFAGLINTPGVAGADTTAPGTTQPGTTVPPLPTKRVYNYTLWVKTYSPPVQNPPNNGSISFTKILAAGLIFDATTTPDSSLRPSAPGANTVTLGTHPETDPPTVAGDFSVAVGTSDPMASEDNGAGTLKSGFPKLDPVPAVSEFIRVSGSNNIYQFKVILTLTVVWEYQ